MSRIVPIAVLTLLGFALVAAGVAWSTWWTVAGGVFALVGAAWLVTDPG